MQSIIESLNNSIELLKKGGKIYIKPENRGKFTALKKRTGKSASWFKAHGTPAQKKMATFALNAKKWHHPKKHQDGGVISQQELFVNKFYDPIAKALLKRGLSLNGIDNILRQTALESGYGEKQSGKNNFSGIKGNKENGSLINKNYYRNFDSIEDWADYHVGLLHDRYNAAEESDPDKFVDKLHAKNHNTGQYNYSESENRYRDIKRMSSLDKVLKGRKPSYSSWYETVPEDYNNTNNYNLERAYELLPFEDLEKWRKDPENNHLPSGIELGNGDYEYLKSVTHPTMIYELLWENGSPDGREWRSQYYSTGSWPYNRLKRKPKNYIEYEATESKI